MAKRCGCNGKGVPIGNYLSQYFANLYLTGFDHWCKEELKCRYYYRYADDIVISGESKAHLRNVLVAIKIGKAHSVLSYRLKVHGIDNLGKYIEQRIKLV